MRVHPMCCSVIAGDSTLYISDVPPHERRLILINRSLRFEVRKECTVQSSGLRNTTFKDSCWKLCRPEEMVLKGRFLKLFVITPCIYMNSLLGYFLELCFFFPKYQQLRLHGGNGSFVVSSFIYVPSLNPKLFQLENLKNLFLCLCWPGEEHL